MRRALVVVCLAASIWTQHPAAFAYDDGGDSPRCYEESDYGCQHNGSDYSNDDRNRNRNRNRGAFSPGPFDRSPVDIHDNNVCISPDCSQHRDEPKK